MPPNARTTGTVPGPSRKRGCLRAAAVAAGATVLVAFLVAGGCLWHVRRLRATYTDPTPVALPVAEVSPEAARRLGRTVERLQGAIDAGRRERFTFTEAQINELIAVLPGTEPLRGRARVALGGDRVTVQAAIPLDQVPGCRGRYLNGEFVLDVRVENGQCEVFVREAAVRGKPLPEVFLRELRGRNLAQQAMQSPEWRRLLAGIRSLRIADGTVEVETGR